jgi:1,4-dihydroxy-2-naphthoate octaprenyltransferase
MPHVDAVAVQARPFPARLIYAVKLASWPKLLAPILLGQAIGVCQTGTLFVRGLAFSLLFAVLDITYVVLLNDWGDRRVDAIKRRRFPHGCSPKTIPDGILEARTVLGIGLGAGLLLLGSAALAGHLLGRPQALWLTLICVAVFVFYTFEPLALNYRGGGELLEMIGVGVLLPWVSSYFQSGRLWSAELSCLTPALACLALSSALASGLSDEDSDREGHKCTFTTLLGNARTRRLVESCYAIGIVLLALLPLSSSRAHGIWAWPAVIYMALFIPTLSHLSSTATTQAFRAQGRYKVQLHLGLWGGQLILAATLLLMYWRATTR